MPMQLTRREAMLMPVLAAGSCTRPQDVPQQKLRILVVDGFSNHDWRKTTAFIRTTLSETDLFEVAGSTSPGEPDAAGWAEWRPTFSDYDAVVLNMNNIQQPEIRWPREVELALESYVKGGGGLLVYHSANNAFPHWSEYDRMIGLGWRDKDHGTALRLDAAGTIERIPPGEGNATSHGPRQDTLVIRLNDHPITHGAPERWMTPDIEVYTYARGPAEELTVLTYGRHIATDSYWPLEWVVNYDQGRVYNSSFGHIWKTDEGVPDRVRCVGFQTSLIRAAEWTATAAAGYAIPEDFPREDAVSLRASRAEFEQINANP
ncbi:MAG: ThuA domain-containing protein, partial [Acidobacteria bacterium]|nr:ThuA domain-containing protein [Acidobacteriota bacterium]